MDLLHPIDAGGASRQQQNATDPATWRTVAQASERAARLWEAVARNLAGATPDGAAVLHRQMLAHGLAESVPTDSEGAES
jgi:hypothetical protein